MFLNPIILNDLQTRLAEMEPQIMTEPFSDHLWWGFNKNYKARCKSLLGFFLILKGGFHICNMSFSFLFQYIKILHLHRTPCQSMPTFLFGRHFIHAKMLFCLWNLVIFCILLITYPGMDYTGFFWTVCWLQSPQRHNIKIGSFFKLPVQEQHLEIPWVR